MSISVNTNTSALLALQNLNKSTDSLIGTQGRVSTGLKVATARDNASVWAIAQKQRASVSSLQAVTDSLNRATSIADVANAAGSSISDLLNLMKQKAVAAMEPSLDESSRTLLNGDYQALVKQVGQIISNANFDGANILDGSVNGGLSFLADSEATTFITLAAQNFSLGGSIVTFGATSSISTTSAAAVVMGQISASITHVNQALANLGAQTNQIEAHNKFVTKLSDALTTGIGHMVDADMATESAKLQALQVQQQLGAQALSIANQAPQIILSLFKG
jgi:flagellin